MKDVRVTRSRHSGEKKLPPSTEELLSGRPEGSFELLEDELAEIFGGSLETARDGSFSCAGERADCTSWVCFGSHGHE